MSVDCLSDQQQPEQRAQQPLAHTFVAWTAVTEAKANRIAAIE
jgi:hypothetical protein